MTPVAPSRWAVSCGHRPLYECIADTVEAESLGYGECFISEKSLGLDVFAACALLLNSTNIIRIGPGIVGIYDRHPLRLVFGALALDTIAPGRTFLGIGRGDASDLTPLMLEQTPSLSGLTDAAVICRSLILSGKVEYKGRAWSAHLTLPDDVQRHRPIPLIIAAMGSKTLNMVGHYADGVILNFGLSPAYVRWAVSEIHKGADKAGRSPSEITVYGHVLVARTDQADSKEQINRAVDTLSWIFSFPDQGMVLAAPAGGIPSRWDARSCKPFVAMGNKKECDSYIESLREAGLDCPILLPHSMRSLHANAS